MKFLYFFLFIFAFLLFASPAQAAVLYMKPLGGNMTKGVVFPIEIRLSARTENITSTSAYLNYPADKLDIVYAKPGSSFPVNVGINYGNGTFAMTRDNASGVNGDVLVTTIGFKPKVDNTTVEIRFIDGIKTAQASGVDTIDAEWTKNSIGKYNIIENPGGSAQGGIDVLPTAGLNYSTILLFILGFGFIISGTAGLAFNKLKRS